MEIFSNKRYMLLLERVQRRATKFTLGDYSMDYKSRLTSMNLHISYLQSNLSKNLQAVLIYLSIYNLMNQQLDFPTLSFVTRFTTIPSLLILIFVGYLDYGMLYQS